MFIFSRLLLQAYIPKTLDDVKNAEEDVQRITSGKDTEDLYYKTTTGLKVALSRVQLSSKNGQQEQELKSTGGDSEASSGDEDNQNGSEESSYSESEAEAPVDKKAARKENKKKVKEEKREARKHKVPKAVKKRKKKLAKALKNR